MKKIILTMLFLMILVCSGVSARKGVGIVWETETEIVNEGARKCIDYGLYNPWKEDVTAMLGVSEEFKDIIVSEESDVKVIKANTKHDDAVMTTLCFEVKEVYSKDCRAGPFLCEKTCKEDPISYSGSIIAKEITTGKSGGGAGSSTSLGVSVPLKLKVSCSQEQMSFLPIYAALLVIVVLVIYWRKKKK